jgi:methyl-accepting chemotaxis protein
MFKNLSLKFKLLSIIIPMGLTIFVTSIFIIKYYQEQGSHLAGMAKVTDAFDNFGNLTESIQSEKELARDYINDNLTLEEFKKFQVEKTDTKIPEVKRMLTIIPFDKAEEKIIFNALNSLALTRKKVEKYEISPNEINLQYTKIVEDLELGILHGALIYNGDGIQEKLLTLSVLDSLVSALRSMRIPYASAFHNDGPITTLELEKLNGHIAIIDTIVNTPILQLMHNLSKNILEVMHGEVYTTLKKDMSAVTNKFSKGSYGIDYKDYNNRMLSIIEKVSGITKNERLEILKESQTLEEQARRKLYIVIFCLSLTIVGIVFFTWKILSEIIHQEAELHSTHHEASRSSAMVETSPIGTMMCLPDGTIIYANQSVLNTLNYLKAYVPGFSSDVIGKSIDIFHNAPDMQKKIISDPRNLPHSAICAIGPEKLKININAIMDENGIYMGASLTWELVTAKIELIENLNRSSTELEEASKQIELISSHLSSSAEQTAAQANSASGASEQVNAGVQNVANNISNMVSAIKEITKTTNEAASMTNEAMRITKKTNTIINKLGESSMDIGNVIKVISSIAQQTNLLALNATIEAARAGEAGKGFAVVANEVKELANQTAKATNEITKKIENIQIDSKSAVDAIAEITQAIEKVNGFTANIAASVEVQAATTNEVTRIVTEAAEGVKLITENINQVSEAANSTGNDANNTRGAAMGVGETAGQLSLYVSKLNV